MATAVEDAFPSPRLTDNASKEAQNLLSRRQLDGINLLLSTDQPGQNEMTQRTIHAFGHETIKELRIQLRKKEFFTSKDCLVFGDRHLLENETNNRQVDDENGQYLHVLAKLSDIDALEVTTDKQRRSTRNDDRQRESALATYFRMHGVMTMSNTYPLLLCGRVLENGSREYPTPRKIDPFGEPVVHLFIRKSSKVHWHHLSGERFELRITADATVDDVKRKIEEVTEGFEPDKHAVVKAGHTLQPNKPLSELGVERGDVLEVVKVPLRLEEYLEPSAETPLSPKAEMPTEWEQAKDALASGIKPKLSTVGTGGSYFISASGGRNLAVFKPEDEEPRAPNNPRGFNASMTGDGLRKGVRPGEGATREVIAFTLDHNHFSGVPPTTMVTLTDSHDRRSHRKVGSFQRFVQHDVDCEEMGPSNFPVREVHKICVLDIRLANTDRNAGNILARHKEDGTWALTPIDHGYCLPDSFSDINFEWMYWRQAKVEFDDATKKYIQNLDAVNDLQLLEKAGLQLRPECIRVFRVCTMLLLKSLTHGLTPYQIAEIMCRQSANMSPLEKLHVMAIKLISMPSVPSDNRQINEALYLETMSHSIDEFLIQTRETATGHSIVE